MIARSEELAVAGIPEPVWTDTWHPISHKRCIENLTSVFDHMNLPVIRKDYSLSKDNNQVFASWVLDKREIDGLSPTVIWRNSTDKQFPFGIAGGTHTFICSNLAFTADSFLEFRKHTKGMDDGELYRVMLSGVEKILPLTDSFSKWHLSLHDVKLSYGEMKELAYDAIINEVVSRRKVNQFNEMLFGEQPSYTWNELHGFHGACTELMRDTNMTNSMSRQASLFSFISERYGKYLPEIKTVQ